MAKGKWRVLSVRRLRRHLLQHRSPRFDMSIVLALTGVVGFAASAGLMRLGLLQMSLRYPAAAALAYVFFLCVVSLLVTGYKRRLEAELSDLSELVEKPRADSGPEGPDLLSDLSGVDGDEGCLIALIIALVAGLVLVMVYVVMAAPTLLAELLLDSLLIGGLYRRIKKVDSDYLFIAVFRRTWGPALAAIVMLALVGAGFETYAPEAESIGEVLEKAMAPNGA